MNHFHDTIPAKRGPVEITPAEADAAIRASWPARTGSSLRLVQPMAAEAATEVDELPADHEFDWPRTQADDMAAAVFWRRYLIVFALLASAAGVWRFWPA